MNRALIITGVGIIALVCGICNLPSDTPETYMDGIILNTTTVIQDYRSIVIHSKIFYLVCFGGAVSLVGLVLIYRNYNTPEIFPQPAPVLKGILKRPVFSV